MSKISLKHSGGNVVSLNSPTSAPTSADVAFKLPNADGSADQVLKTDGSGNLSFGAAGVDGITEADQWRIPTTYSTSGDAVITSWERNDSNFEVIGSGMTESSGIFTFPSTGKYLIMASLNANASNAQYIGIVIKYTAVSYTHLTLPTKRIV